MNLRRKCMWMFLALVCQGEMLLSASLSYAGNIIVTIDGQGPPDPSEGSCTNPAVCVNIGGTYGVLTVVPYSGGNARVEFTPPLTDPNHDTLQIVNARITNTGGGDRTFLVRFEQEDAQQPSSTKYYNTYLNGNFSGVAGNAITSKSFYRRVITPPENYAQVGSTLSHTVTCPSSCSTAFSKKTGVQRNPGTNLRWVKIELTITLKPGSHVDLNSGAQIITSGNPPDLSAGELVNGPTDLSVLCSTTYSTAKMFGCPSCVNEDGQVAANAKVKLFVLTNWDNLQQDIAQGNGEYLASLARLLEIPANRRSEFFSFAQNNYRAATINDTPEQTVASLQTTWSRQYREVN